MPSAFASRLLARMAPGPVLLLGCAFALAGTAGCHGAQVREQNSVVRREIEKARQSGALRCAPRDLAIAEANHVFAAQELHHGNSGRAEEHVHVAAAAVRRALDDSKDCGPTKVIIRNERPVALKVAVKDSDSDGILDKDDKCPEEPEDKDGLEDEDGCPEADNDKDGVADAADRCPNNPGPVANFGCPVLDKDGDGIPDDIDRCPEQPEDRDGFEDDDGCPEVDNDQDGVLDGDDECPMDKGPASNKGCPVGDKDGDGILDDIDRCVDDPEDKDQFEDEDGCPEIDNDKDGIKDAEDACPLQPGPVSNKGCPVLDKDGDGILDDTDKCPEQPEDKDQFEDLDGCPDLDNDQDGVGDKDDSCPNEAGVPELQGCPPKDRDGDGVPDHIDRCPDEPGVVEEQGCPRKYSLVVLKKEKIEIRQQVHFATNKHVILPDSFELLNQVASILKDYPRIKIRIEGHTDSVSADDFNLKLSQRRADAVREYLVAQGVGGDRMVSVGYGETKPIATNATSKGRAANRRVEFNITEK